MASPLILNHNIFPGPKAVDPAVTEIITNKEVIAINQDALGKSAVRIDGSATWDRLLHRTPMQPAAWRNGEQLEKPLANGDIAVLLFNRRVQPKQNPCRASVCAASTLCFCKPSPGQPRVTLSPR